MTRSRECAAHVGDYRFCTRGILALPFFVSPAVTRRLEPWALMSRLQLERVSRQRHREGLATDFSQSYALPVLGVKTDHPSSRYYGTFLLAPRSIHGSSSASSLGLA